MNLEKLYVLGTNCGNYKFYIQFVFLLFFHLYSLVAMNLEKETVELQIFFFFIGNQRTIINE